ACPSRALDYNTRQYRTGPQSRRGRGVAPAWAARGGSPMATLETPASTHSIPAGAFTQMGWAFLFIGLTLGPSIRLGQESFTIDLLPDFIGYPLIATAANRLLPLCRQARSVRNLAMFLTFLSVPATIQYTAVASQSGAVTTWTAPLWPFSTVVGLLELVLV